MQQPLLVANWKMNGNLVLLDEMHQVLLGQHNPTVDVVLCPPFVFLPYTQTLFKESKIAYGAQDVSDQDYGAYTGQICAKMLSQWACTYVIIGHSERRQYCGETDTLIAAKCIRAIDEGLIPILCVGENAQQKQRNETQDVIFSQVQTVLARLNVEQMAKLVIAYEPVWAIGTGMAADPEAADEVHRFIRECAAKFDSKIANNMRILYGGSVNADNIRTFLLQPNINGALIGGAALKADVLMQMINTASEIKK